MVADLPAVGKNLQDHPAVGVAAHLKAHARQPAAMRSHSNLCFRYSSGLDGCHDLDVYVSVNNKTSWHPLGTHFAALTCCLYKPYSRGQVTLRSASAEDEPKVEMNFLSDPRDLARLKGGMRLFPEIYRQPSVRAVVNHIFPASYSERVRRLNQHTRRNWALAAAGSVLMDGPAAIRRHMLRNIIAPGDDLEALLADDGALESWIRERATGYFHPVGTCRMGAPDDPQAVVDPTMKVRGLDGLRVVDASIMPHITRAPTNLTTIMIAEKAADVIRAGE